ncbi:hypothetical protein Fot_41292 [Forsythia ovata]|uniref:Uncharacterized protein n=1 Tax=Forsythia ovata TaxID=205694 RepID=A0ABD1RHX2_9LAMI
MTAEQQGRCLIIHWIMSFKIDAAKVVSFNLEDQSIMQCLIRPILQNYQFMPTPGIGLSNHAIFFRSRPALNQPESPTREKEKSVAQSPIPEAETETLSINTMIEDMEEMQ